VKTISVRDLQQKIRECVEAAQRERVVVTRHGAPAAILIGIEGFDWEQVMLQTSPAFWKMIGERRAETTSPLKQVRRRLGRRAIRRGKRRGTA
jgi:prevent-host-death family protein